MRTKSSSNAATPADRERQTGQQPTLGGKLIRPLLHLDNEKLRAEAKRRTGLEDFGSPSLEPALSTLLNSLEDEARLHSLGRLLMRIHLRDLLETRLRLASLWKSKLEALDAQRIENPVFIVGMPRSGSTFLHELLAEDPGNRAPRVWEVMFPVARRPRDQDDQARRIRKAAMCLWWFRRLAPQADAVYPMRANTPHECVAIHSYTFLSEEFISTCRIPVYEAFLRSADLTPVYAWEKRFLQHLQLGHTAKRWVLKSPDHSHSMEELFAIFPDALIVQTHRNPVEVLKSSAELTRVLHGLYGRPAGLEEIQAREARMLAESTDRFMEFRDQHPEFASRFVDVKYTELVADPLAVVRRIHQQLDAPLTDVAAERIKQMAANRSRYRGRRASEEPATLKPQTALETTRFQRYCSRFGIPFQGADPRW